MFLKSNLNSYYFLVQKNAFFCTKHLILLYKRKQSFVQDIFNQSNCFENCYKYEEKLYICDNPNALIL